MLKYPNILQSKCVLNSLTSKWKPAFLIPFKSIASQVEIKARRSQINTDYPQGKKEESQKLQGHLEKKTLVYLQQPSSKNCFSRLVHPYHTSLILQNGIRNQFTNLFQSSIHTGLCAYGSTDGGEWDYARKGPAEWKLQFPDCSGKYQSPIALERNCAQTRELNVSQCFISFHKYDKNYDGELMNNGATLTMTLCSPTENDRPCIMITQGDWKARYSMTGFHFHWPSEHVLDGVRYDLELHMLHEEKITKHVAVFSTLFEVDSKKTEESSCNGFNILCECIEKLKESGSRVLMKSFPLDSLLPFNYTRGFFAYVGSFTTPPCSGGILWIVQSKPLMIQQSHMESFLHVRSSSGHPMIGNFRPLQPSDGRVILYFE